MGALPVCGCAVSGGSGLCARVAFGLLTLSPLPAPNSASACLAANAFTPHSHGSQVSATLWLVSRVRMVMPSAFEVPAKGMPMGGVPAMFAVKTPGCARLLL